MKRIFLTLIVLLLLSGCTVDPAALALIPTPLPEPPHQTCESERELVFVSHQGPSTVIVVYCGDHTVVDRCLLECAENAIARDDGQRMLEAFGKDAKKIEVTAFYMSLFMEADRSCLENRAELATLIDTYSQEYRDRDYIGLPLLAVIDLLSSGDGARGGRYISTGQDTSIEVSKVDCNDTLAALSVFPDPPPLCIAYDPDADRGCFNDAPNTNASVAPGQSGPDELAITPGQTVTDEISGTLADHIEVTEVATSLSGETLTAVFHLRDVPESLTFDRPSIPEGYVECMWEVSIDVDNDPKTGVGEFEYTLFALHFVPPSGRGANTTETIEEKVSPQVWALSPDGRTSIRKTATLEVSTLANTIMLAGDISGIPADSLLAFRTYDYLSGFDKAGCHVWPVKSTDQEEACGSDSAIIMPGQTVSDDLSDVSVAHIDITAVSTTLSGETLTAVFHLRDVPETLTFDRIGIRPRVLEYYWMISIDIDYEPEQGSAEFDYTLTADHSVLPSDSGKNVAAPIEAKLETDTGK